MPWPTGQSHYISYAGSGYGCNGHSGARSAYAMDFETGYGAEVSAVADGLAHTVTDWGYGNMVWIEHGYGIVSIYAHLSSFAIGDGARVGRGQLVGYTGQSGSATGPHLHFEMHSNGTGPYNGNALRPEPMSGYWGFGDYGNCTGRSSPWYESRVP